MRFARGAISRIHSGCICCLTPNARTGGARRNAVSRRRRIASAGAGEPGAALEGWLYNSLSAAPCAVYVPSRGIAYRLMPAKFAGSHENVDGVRDAV